MNDIHADILIFGTGSFAGRIALDLAATASDPVTVVIAGRNTERLDWLRTAGNARAAMFNRPARVMSHQVDLSAPNAAAAAIAAVEPKVIVQAASFQSGNVISNQGNAWTKLVAEGGLSATAVLQAPLSIEVARAVKTVRPQAHFINCCFPDVVNPLIAALDLPISCGVGNIAILANAFAGTLGAGAGRLKVLAHYQNIAPWRQPAETRAGRSARVWIDDREVADVYARFRGVQLTREPAIEISGPSGVPLMLAMARAPRLERSCAGTERLARRLSGEAQGRPRRARSPGLAYARRGDCVEFALRGGERPHRRRRTAARLTPVFCGERLEAFSPVLAGGFHVRDIADASRDMNDLRSRLEHRSP